MSLILVQKNISFMGLIFIGIKNMNSTFAVITTLVKSNIEKKCLIRFLMNVSTKTLRDYLECTSIYKETSLKKN